MDQFLEDEGFFRKHIPRDSSCLFRAVSERVFHCQTYHLEIRQQCVQYLTENKVHFQGFVEGDYEDFLNNVGNPKVYAGLVEMNALSLLYRHDFLVFQEHGHPPSEFTKNHFDQTILLCYSQGNHYDLVYRREQLNSLAFCQALVYGILYKKVFGLGDDVDYAVQKMLYDKAYSKKKKSLAVPYFRSLEERREKCRIKEIDEENPSGDGVSEIREMLAQGCPPFPYKVAKALDPGIYRNVEFDRWNQARREQERSEQLVVPDFAPGVKCLVRLMENQMFHAHIQEMSPDHGPVTVFIEELGEKKVIPFDHLQPLAIPVYKALAMQGFNCKKSIRFLDGCLKNSPLVSLSTIVADGFRNSKRYLRKKAKDLSFLLPVSDKQAICWINNTSSTGSSSPPPAPHSPPAKNKQPPRYLNEKLKSLSSPNEDKQMNKVCSSENSVENAAFLASSSNTAKLQSQSAGYSTSPFIPPQLPGMQGQGMGRGCTSIPSMPAPVQPMISGNPLAMPFVPYTFLGPVAGAGVPTANGTPGELVMDNSLFNSGLAMDAFGMPFFYALGTCEVPYLVPPMDRPMRSPMNGVMTPAASPMETVANGTSGMTPPVPQAGTFWTYNGSFTYLSTPVPGAGSGMDTCDWAIADEASQGFQQFPPGVPLLFFVTPPQTTMTPPSLTPGVITTTQGSFLPTVTSV